MNTVLRNRLGHLRPPGLDFQRKNGDTEPISALLSVSSGPGSPDIQQPDSPPIQLSPVNVADELPNVQRVGNYFLAAPLYTARYVQAFKAFHCETQKEYVCKVIPLEKYKDIVPIYYRIGSHEHINEIEEIILGKTKAYVFFGKHFGDLHTYMRTKRRLREAEVRNLFRQIVSVVEHCHQNGVVLRDLKLGKVVFKDPERTRIKLEGLEDACVLDKDGMAGGMTGDYCCDLDLEEENDLLTDKYCCPAYASPEMLLANRPYSGRAADVWSLGVMLYTLLLGRFPFNDVEAVAVLKKIRRGHYTIPPEALSSRARCLVHSLLRRNPEERLRARDAARHSWFSEVHWQQQRSQSPAGGSVGVGGSVAGREEGKDVGVMAMQPDHVVPQVPAKAGHAWGGVGGRGGGEGAGTVADLFEGLFK